MAEPQTHRMVVEINLSDIVLARGEEGQTFPGYVARMAADKLLEGEARGSYHEVFRTRVAAIRDEEIRAVVRPLIEEALAATVRTTDEFGTPRGEPKELRTLIVERAESELRLKREASRPGLGRGTRSLLEEVIDDAVRRELKGELSAAVAEGRQQVLAAVKDQAAEVIAETIARASRA